MADDVVAKVCEGISVRGADLLQKEKADEGYDASPKNTEKVITGHFYVCVLLAAIDIMCVCYYLPSTLCVCGTPCIVIEGSSPN